MQNNVLMQNKTIQTSKNDTLAARPLKDTQTLSTKGDHAPPIVGDVLQSSGEHLDEQTQSFMESRFNHDFSQVHIHNDTQAAQSAEAVNAEAYTVGQDVVFGDGQYQPHTDSGKRLMAHELTHVAQQSVATSQSFAHLQIDEGTSASEQEAATNAHRVVDQGQLASLNGTGTGHAASLQRQAKPDAAGNKSNKSPSVDSMNASLTLDAFVPDSAVLTSAHMTAIAAYKKQIAQLLKQYPGASINITGHTDATASEKHTIRCKENFRTFKIS